jgi:hypothetical protein
MPPVQLEATLHEPPDELIHVPLLCASTVPALQIAAVHAIRAARDNLLRRFKSSSSLGGGNSSSEFPHCIDSLIPIFSHATEN